MLSEEDFDEPEPPEDEDDDDDDDAIDENDDNVAIDEDDQYNPDEEFVELDPSGCYGRYAEVLGKGATKTVYKAYDLVDCKEVAWNQAKANTHAEGPVEEALAIEREIILLQRLNFKGIIKIYYSWVDEPTGDTNFITELCSTTLLAFRLKHKHVSRKAVKSWARQILETLVYLHTQDPPIIHRDLKSENIFMKSSSSTTLRIGDFGSATILNETRRMHTLVGTPEFMAPEMFQQDYDELVDVYSFGMCMLELVTRECPYSECTSLEQIYKQVIGGQKPKSLLKVKDVQALQFINRCLLPACKRPSAKELLDDPFLQHKEVSANCMRPSNSMPSLRDFTTSVPGKLLFGDGNASRVALLCGSKEERSNGSIGTNVNVITTDLVSKAATCIVKDASLSRSYQVMGRKEDENTLQLRIRRQESSRCSNIVFTFDLRNDTPKSVAEEMVRTLKYPQSDMLTIADLISQELAALALILEDGLAAPTCSEKSEGSILKQQQTDNSLICAASCSDTYFVESNTPFEETTSGSEKGCFEISASIAAEKSKEILYDNSSASLIVDASSGASTTNEPFKESASSISGELRHDERFPKSAASASDVAKRSGDLHRKSSSIASHDKGSILKQQQTGNSLICAASCSDTAFVENNTPFEETATESEKGCFEISPLVPAEKSKEILYDNSSPSLIVVASLGVSTTNEPFKESALSASGELRHDEPFPKSTVWASDEKTDRSLAKRSGALHGKSSSIASHNKRLRPLVFKKFLNFKRRPPSEQGIQRRRPLYVNTLA